MATDVLSSISDGGDVFLDANIFVYAFTGTPTECRDLLTRCAQEDVIGVTSYEVINEVTHRLMVYEAYHKGLISQPRAVDLKRRPTLVPCRFGTGPCAGRGPSTRRHTRPWASSR
jgi:hypothetical protein